MAIPGQFQSCNTKINLRAASFRLVLAILLGLTTIVATRIAQAQSYQVIHNFMDGADGDEPNYGLTIDASGNLYGTTFSGDYGTGTVFMLSPGHPNWVLTPLYVLQEVVTGLLLTLQSSSDPTAVSMARLGLAECRIRHA
jgi:hypothetical protein